MTNETEKLVRRFENALAEYWQAECYEYSDKRLRERSDKADEARTALVRRIDEIETWACRTTDIETRPTAEQL